MEIFSLLELNQYIRQSLVLNFPEEYWVEAELSNVKESRGNIYCELVETEQIRGMIVAQSNAVLWRDSYSKIVNTLSSDFKNIFRNGSHVRLRVAVDYHERYGLKLNIKDIQPEYTLGLHEQARQATVSFLMNNGYFELNKKTVLPHAIKHIAVISSPTAAGLQDFLKQLTENNFGYTFMITIFPSVMQGPAVPANIISRLDQINSMSERFDLIAIIRGGGSKLDLSDFDDKNLAIAVAQVEIPVLTGIGHEIDSAVVDLVAYKNLKTPTSVASYIIEYNQAAQLRLTNILEELNWRLQRKLNDSKITLEKQHYTVKNIISSHLSKKSVYLNTVGNQISVLMMNIIKRKEKILSDYLLDFTVSDPATSLKKGYAILSQNGQNIKNIEDVTYSDLTIYILQGRITAIPREIIKYEK